MTEAPENFAGHPETIGSIRAMKSKSGADWTPRDVLIDLLRAIDDGSLRVDTIFVACGKCDGNLTQTSYAQSGKNLWEAQGMIETARRKMWEES